MKDYLVKTLILLLVVLSGCSKKLKLLPLTQITEGNFYNNEIEMQQAVNDVYRQLGNFYGGNGIPSLYGELSGDNGYIRLATGANNYNEQIDQFFISSDNGLIRSMWENAYSSIFICNNVLFHLEHTEVEIEESKLKLMRAQVLLIRSLFYFNMVRAWGAIPYVDKKINYKEAFSYLRTEPDTIYEHLISDLKFCEKTLPEFYTGEDIGRVTKYGAIAILAKIYLTLDENEKAKEELLKIINSNIYSLDANDDGATNVEDFKYIFYPDTKNCKSSILEAQYMSGNNAMNSNQQQTFMPFLRNFHLPGQKTTLTGDGKNTPTKDIISEFEEGDPRVKVSIVDGFNDLTTGNFIEYPYTNKFYDPDFENPGNNFSIIRYADILLLYSKVTNDPQYLNKVRDRVGLPLYGTNSYPSNDFPTLSLAIEHERRVELCFEFHRFFDLVRTNRAIKVMNSKGFNIDKHNLLFPIPLHAIDVNPKLKQNPGY